MILIAGANVAVVRLLVAGITARASTGANREVVTVRVEGTTVTFAVMATVGANVESGRLRVEGETLIPIFAVGANPVVVRLRVEGITAKANLGANAAVVRLAVAGTTLLLSLTLIVGANVAVDSDVVDGMTV